MDKYRSNYDNIGINQDLTKDKWLIDCHEWFIMQYDWQHCRCTPVTIANGFILSSM